MSRKKDYIRYLQSDKWIERKNKVQEERKVCEICGEMENLHVHHLTYENLYNEKDKDLLLVCKGCHFAIHKGIYVVIRNIYGKDFFKSDFSNEILKSLEYSKIKRLYFPKDKVLIVKGDNFGIERKGGELTIFDANKWYMIKE